MASLRRLRRKACTGKIRHATALDAFTHIRALHRKQVWQGHLNAYKCRFCNGYHVGHAPGQ